MILSNASIKKLNLVRNGTNEYRAASYDLTVGTIVTPDGEFKDEYPLKPQGVVKVISAEEVALPANITGYVHVKTGLCNEGVLALNIGIVDPCFAGPLQSTLLNFGKVTQRIRKGAVFGRITFHQHEDPEKAKAVTVTPTKAKEDAQSHVDRFLAADFLDFSHTVSEAAKRAASEYRNTLFWWAPAFAILLAVFTFLLNFANMSRLEGYISVKDRVTEAEGLKDLTAEVARLEARQDDLLAELKRLKSKERNEPATPQPNAESPARHQ